MANVRILYQLRNTCGSGAPWRMHCKNVRASVGVGAPSDLLGLGKQMMMMSSHSPAEAWQNCICMQTNSEAAPVQSQLFVMPMLPPCSFLYLALVACGGFNSP